MSTPIRPEDVLPDGQDTTTLGGVEVRKGSVAAFVANARLLPSLTAGTAEHDAVVQELRLLVPALRAAGVLDVFEPRSADLAAIIGQRGRLTD